MKFHSVFICCTLNDNKVCQRKDNRLLGPSNPENKTRARTVLPADEGVAELS